MKIMITGGCGFIGTHLSERLLEEGHDVTVVDINVRNKVGGIEYISSNVSDLIRRDVRDVDVVYYLASHPSVRETSSDPWKSFGDIRDMYEFFLIFRECDNLQKVIFTSSSAVYGYHGWSSHTHPVSYYGASKVACEAFIKLFSEFYSFKYSIFRLGNVVGCGGHGVVQDFISKLRKNPEILEILGNGRQEKSYIYIDDCIDILVEDLSFFHDNIIGNVSSFDTISVDRVANIVSEEMSVKPKFIYTSNRKEGWKGDAGHVGVRIIDFPPFREKIIHNSEESVRQAVRDELHKDEMEQPKPF